MKKIYLIIREDKTIEGYGNKFEQSSIEYDIEDSDFIYFKDNYEYAKFADGKIIYNQLIKINEENKKNIRYKIIELKSNLENTDYKIIKCYEAFMRQLPLPYNLEELAIQRDMWRAEINQLEQELAELE